MKKKNTILVAIIIVIIFFILIIANKSHKKKILINNPNKKNDFYFEKYSEGKKKFSIKGNRYYLGNDKQIHVQGDVKTVFYFQGKQIKINSDELTYTFDLKNLFFKKNVIINIGDINLYSDEIFYADLIVLKSTKRVRLESKAFSFKANNFHYNFKKEILVFKNLEDFTINKGDNIYFVQATNLFYYKKTHMLTLKGTPVKITTDKKGEHYEYSFPHINIFLNKDNSLKEGKTPLLLINIKNNDKKNSITRDITLNNINYFWNNGKLSSVISNENGQLIHYYNNIKRVFNFKGINISFFDSGDIKSIILKKLQMLFYDNKKRFGFGRAGITQIGFKRRGDISYILLTDKDYAFIIDKKYKSAAKNIFIYPDEDISILNINSGMTIQEEISISANYLYSNKKQDIIKGEKNVRGSFLKDNMNFICDNFKQTKDSVYFRDKVYIKKGKMELKGDSVDFNRKKHIFIIKNGNIKKDEIFIKGKEIKKMREKIEIREDIIFKKGDLTVTGETADILIKKGKYDKAIIDKNVNIQYDKGQGIAERIIVNLDKQLVQMIGNAKFNNKKNMKVEGDKLTLNLRNGKIYAVSKNKKKVKIILKKENDKSN
jgi:lipopolysaccharide export system protein LptA